VPPPATPVLELEQQHRATDGEDTKRRFRKKELFSLVIQGGWKTLTQKILFLNFP